MLADTRFRTRPRVAVGALSSDGATALGLALVVLGGGVAVALWATGFKAAAVVSGIATLGLAPRIASAAT